MRMEPTAIQSHLARTARCTIRTARVACRRALLATCATPMEPTAIRCHRRARTARRRTRTAAAVSRRVRLATCAMPTGPTDPVPPPCANGATPNPSGSGCLPPCAPGYVRDADGTDCDPVPPCANGSTPNLNGTGCLPPCAPGYVRDADGTDCDPASQPCPNEGMLNTSGNCVPPPPIGSGEPTCGTITITDSHPSSNDPGGAATCFYSAYQACTQTLLTIEFKPAGGNGSEEVLEVEPADCSVQLELVVMNGSTEVGPPTYHQGCSLALDSGGQPPVPTRLSINACADGQGYSVPLS
jgi:hypothetical protein